MSAHFCIDRKHKGPCYSIPPWADAPINDEAARDCARLVTREATER